MELLQSKKKLEVELEEVVQTLVKLDTVKVTSMKLWLSHGLKFLRHPEKSGGSYISTLKMSGTHLYYRKKDNPTKLESDHWESISLYSIKYVIEGFHSARLKKTRADPLACFEIVLEEV